MAGIDMEITGAYGYVLLVLVLYIFLNFYMAFKVGKARKKYKVKYPNLYATDSESKDAHMFNCIQRGHQNSLEVMPIFIAVLLIAGIQYPRLAAGFGLVYTVGRYFYFTGYATGVPDNRVKHGGFYIIGLFGLIICTASLGISLLAKELL